MSFPGYGSYTESGVEWLGEVPSHWSVCALGYRYEVALGKMLDEKRISGDYLGPYLRNTDVQWGKINVDDLPQMDFADSEIQRYSLVFGDLLVCEGGDVGRAAIWKGDLARCFYQKALHRLRPYAPADDPRFFYYVLEAAAALGIFTAEGGKATIAHLTAESFRRHRFPFPGSTEQRAIAAFLDRETAKIDALVEAQRRLIELLKEKRQAVISHAVTKGLDPSAPMKDSGVEWLGEVPAHWEVLPVRALFRFVKRQNGDELDVLSVYREYGVISKSSRDDNNNVTPEDLSKYQTVHPGDLVVNKMKAWQGSLGVSGLHGITSPDYAVFAPIHAGLSNYLHLLLRSQLLPDVYRLISNGIRLAQWRLEPEKFKELKVPFPPIAEQQAISEALVQSATQMDRLAMEAEAGIALLQERRAALISAAVTGKIDVRGLIQTAEAA